MAMTKSRFLLALACTLFAGLGSNVATAGSPGPCANEGLGCDVDGDCNDGFFCTGDEFCDTSQPQGGFAGTCACNDPAPDCDDFDVCTIDFCDGSMDACVHDPLCVDPFPFCDPARPQGDECVECLVDTDCDDNIGCTTESCNDGICFLDVDATFCDDSLACNGDEVCDPGDQSADPTTGCVPGTPVVCLPGEICDEVDGCRGCIDDFECDDGLFCNGRETCEIQNVAGQRGLCVPGTPPDCNDGLSCTDDSCDEGNDQCVNEPVESRCNDGLFCNGIESCSPGADPQTNPTGCTVVGTNCLDLLACTDDSCDEGNDECVHTPNNTTCDDGRFCNGEEWCNPDALPGDGCEPAPTSVICPPGLFCSEIAGACVECDSVDDCDDGITCTNDICSNNVCSNVPLDTFCADTSFCNGVETCNPNAAPGSTGCEPGTLPECPPTHPICAPEVDACVDCTLNSECSDGLFCNGIETCNFEDFVAAGQVGSVAGPNGVPTITYCRPGLPPICNDNLDCTADSCEESSVTPGHVCRFEPNNAICDDLQFCNGVEQCLPDFCTTAACVVAGLPSGCVPGLPPSCGDSFACTMDVCDEVTDRCVNTPNHQFCSDGLACDGEERCDPDPNVNVAGDDGCREGTPPSCDDWIDCTIDRCQELTVAGRNYDCIHEPDHSFCDNGIFCDGKEQCVPDPDLNAAGGSVSGCIPSVGPVECPKGLVCHPCVDACAECTSDGDCLDDNPCTINRCVQGTCSTAIIDFCPPVPAAFAPVTAGFSTKGSLLIFPKVELKWDENDVLIQDTFLSVWNDDDESSVDVQAYFINGDPPLDEICSGNPCIEIIQDAEPGWNKFDCRFALTKNQSGYWSAANGNGFCPQAFTELDNQGPGRPDPETMLRTRVLRGYVLMWAVGFNACVIGNDGGEYQEIRHNDLTGSALVVNYAEGSAWEYSPYAFQAREVEDKEFTGTPGVLNLDGLEYDVPTGTLVLDFYGVGATHFSSLDRFGAPDVGVTVDTDLTLVPVPADLRQDNDGPIITKAEFSVYNENESKLSGTRRCIQCWDETLLSRYGRLGIPNNFRRDFLGTDKGYSRIVGLASRECDFIPPFYKRSSNSALLGVVAKLLTFDNPPADPKIEIGGMNIPGYNQMPAQILYDIVSGSPEARQEVRIAPVDVKSGQIDKAPVPDREAESTRLDKAAPSLRN